MTPLRAWLKEHTERQSKLPQGKGKRTKIFYVRNENGFVEQVKLTYRKKFCKIKLLFKHEFGSFSKLDVW